MKRINFLTMVLVCNFIIAIAMDWKIYNTILVIINSLAVLALIAIKIFGGNYETKRNKTF